MDGRKRRIGWKDREGRKEGGKEGWKDREGRMIFFVILKHY